jgi:hypothetical protein
MKINLGDRIIAYLALISGLTISSVAVWYSVAGLVSIFAAAAVPIIVMGVTLEISKLIATVWLKLNWNRAPQLIKIYLCAAIAILMVITSMGIFGFLSKAHSDQSLVSGDVQSKIAVYDEKIKVAKENIDANRKALKQMDEAVDQVMGRSQDEKGADKAVALRRGQAKERTRLLSEIAAEQKVIAQLSEERAPIAAEVRKVEAEVGPIKYIAAFVYGDNPDANVLEKAVTWVIIIIVSVFDPLAVILLLASQYSFQWFRQAREQEESTEGDSPEKESNDIVESTATVTEQAPVIIEKIEPQPVSIVVPVIPEPIVEPEPEPTPEPVVESAPVDDDIEEIESAQPSEKEAMKKWKAENPNDSLKHQKKLLERGMISRLPWEDYLKAQPDVSDAEAAEEAAKWAMEQLERPGDYLTSTEKGYVQNSEQSKSTLWQKIHKP